MRSIPFSIFSLLILFAQSLLADVKLPRVWSNNMVIQQGVTIPIWGWATPKEKIEIVFNGQTKTTVATQEGTWRINFDPMVASVKPLELKVSGKNTITVKNILIGEVWLCTGASNMSMHPDKRIEKPEAKDFPIHLIRSLRVKPRATDAPQNEIGGDWIEVGNNKDVSAVGLYFAKRLVRDLNIPVGFINASQGAAPIESLTPLEGFKLEPKYQSILKEIKEGKLPDAKPLTPEQLAGTVEEGIVPEAEIKKNMKPTYLYNGMMAPLNNFPIKGVLVYISDNEVYKMKAFVSSIRKVWNLGDIPFYCVQRHSMGKVEAENPSIAGKNPILQEFIFKSKDIAPNMGVVVTWDIGEAEEVHFKNKQDVGERLALWALAKNYGKDIPFSGPLYKSHQILNDKIKIEFDCAPNGLMAATKKPLGAVEATPDKPLGAFAIAGADKIFYWAKAEIVGNAILVSSDKVTKPIAVRFNFTAYNPEANLYNTEGLPASPFRTDDWPTK